MFRKLKNRVAAQTARDRKKLKMDELQEVVARLQAENNRLRSENKTLTKKADKLCVENSDLKDRLEGGAVGVYRESNESAVLGIPLLKERTHGVHQQRPAFQAWLLTLKYVLHLLLLPIIHTIC